MNTPFIEPASRLVLMAGRIPAHMHFQPVFALDDLHILYRSPGPDRLGAELYRQIAQGL